MRAKVIEHHASVEDRLYRAGKSFDGRLPQIGSLVIINVIEKDSAHSNLHGERAVIKVTKYTSSLLIGKPVINGEEKPYCCSYRIMDFLKELIIFKEIQEPPLSNNWSELEIAVRGII